MLKTNDVSLIFMEKKRSVFGMIFRTLFRMIKHWKLLLFVLIVILLLLLYFVGLGTGSGEGLITTTNENTQTKKEDSKEIMVSFRFDTKTNYFYLGEKLCSSKRKQLDEEMLKKAIEETQKQNRFKKIVIDYQDGEEDPDEAINKARKIFQEYGFTVKGIIE